MTVCSSDLRSNRASQSDASPVVTPPGPADESPVRRKSDYNTDSLRRKSDNTDNSQSSSVETLTVRDHTARSRSATPIPVISIEPDALDFKAILSFDENQVVTTDTNVAKARGADGDHGIGYSDEDSNDGDNPSTSEPVEQAEAVVEQGDTASAPSNDNDNVSDHDQQTSNHIYTAHSAFINPVHVCIPVHCGCTVT